MTATPKETKEISNIEYFGDPIYTYSLRQGISDGFLAPYKVVRIGLDKDLDGWRPEKGKTDKYGLEIEDREYNVLDYDRNLVLENVRKSSPPKSQSFLSHRSFRQDYRVLRRHRARGAYAPGTGQRQSESRRRNSKYVMRIIELIRRCSYHDISSFKDSEPQYAS
jgi:type I restriction enzyme R subunit